MLGFYVDFIDDLVDSVKRNPAGSTAAAIAGYHLYGAAIASAATVIVPVLVVGGGLYGLGKLLEKKN